MGLDSRQVGSCVCDGEEFQPVPIRATGDLFLGKQIYILKGKCVGAGRERRATFGGKTRNIHSRENLVDLQREK